MLKKKTKKKDKLEKEMEEIMTSAPPEQKPTFDAEISRKMYSNGTRFTLNLTQVDIDDLKEIYNETVNILG